MNFEITYDEKDNPTYVQTWDGYCSVSREFEPEKDGWMLDQISVKDFPIIQQGRHIESLVHLVNELKRENFYLRNQVEQWRKSAGF